MNSWPVVRAAKKQTDTAKLSKGLGVGGTKYLWKWGEKKDYTQEAAPKFKKQLEPRSIFLS